DETIKGITVVATRKEIGARAFVQLKDIHTEWVCFVPYGFTRKGSTDVRYNSERQWWGERIIGTEACIVEAKNQHLKVMLKPQIYIGGGWVGDLDFDTEEQWSAWECNYTSYIMDYAKVAARLDVEMFCVGTEFNIATTKREKYWKGLIADIRKIYKGKLTYSANWDHYEQFKLWQDLDVIGISSYFPLSEEKNPTVGLLVKEWKPIIKKLKSFSQKHNKKILFTEYGYMSVDGCAGKTWELEKMKHQLNINHYAQCNAYDALWTAMSKESFWAGGFLWKWFPEGMGHEGYPEKDYTPQNKPAEKIIKKWFSTPGKI
ncbi:MAG: hypothetical protein WAU01_10100, partial [Saprospiraceae bacterium]